ncbi:MAG: metallopeptidase TldD-related protein [Acidobacteriota bacterium]|nr:metallopeptidase TldD-related protein [Acidobacteriota bacterium]
MKLLAGLIACTAAVAFTFAYQATDKNGDIRQDTQLRAMSDELARSKTLQLNNLDKPYFIEYSSEDIEELVASASLGGLTNSTRLHLRHPSATVKVGNYGFDNTNSVYFSTFNFGLFPLDDDYGAMRTALWRTTDSLYKTATDEITRKRNALREISDPDKTPDLAPAKAVRMIEPVPDFPVNKDAWDAKLRDASERFARHPGVMTSSVRLEALLSTYRLVNSEGTILRVPRTLDELAIRASGRAADGERIWDQQFLTTLDPRRLPDNEALAKAADTVASETEDLSRAPVGEDYSGPVLFEREAAAQMMAQVLTDAVALRRKPIAPPNSNQPGLQVLESVWSSRVGSKVTPEWLSIFDNPLEKTYEGVELAGYYTVDDQGVPAQRVTLVDKGAFKGFLLSRVPIRNLNGSNGHGRLPGAFGTEEAVLGNVFVQAAQALPEPRLKAKLLERVKSAGLKYGIILRRLDFPSTATLGELQSMARQLQKNGFGRTLNQPILAYRVYLNGREELVRGLRFREFSAKDLRDIDAASDRPYVLNFVSNGSGLNIADLRTDATTSSVICPSLLFDSVDLARAENEIGAPPIVPPPPLIAKQ